ncbi:MAG: helix-turn-helix transcriptional regulator [Clostridia bacterium]|nr:helix-turn-helix transcriptional regulator [Clostridia bacterium]
MKNKLILITIALCIILLLFAAVSLFTAVYSADSDSLVTSATSAYHARFLRDAFVVLTGALLLVVALVLLLTAKRGSSNSAEPVSATYTSNLSETASVYTTIHEVHSSAGAGAPFTPVTSVIGEDLFQRHAFDKLSGQELRMAELIIKGYTCSDIAKRLNITENTAKSYRKSLYSKLQIHSRRELYELASGERPN